jgi:hypothetical protein
LQEYYRGPDTKWKFYYHDKMMLFNYYVEEEMMLSCFYINDICVMVEKVVGGDDNI